MNKEFTIPYQSPTLGWIQKKFGKIFTYLSILSTFLYIVIFIYFSIEQEVLSYVSVFFILTPTVFCTIIFYALYDYRNNLTSMKLNKEGVILFEYLILWKDIIKVYRPTSIIPFISISFKYEDKLFRAFVGVDRLFINDICEYISRNSLNENTKFDKSQSMTCNDLFHCLRKPE